MTTFQAGAGEELSMQLNTEIVEVSATDLQIMPHAGNPTGPHKPFARGPSDEVQADLQIQDNPVRGFTVPFQFGGPFRYAIHEMPMRMVMNSNWTAAVSITGTDIATAATGNKFTSATVDKFNSLTPLVPCPIWIVRNAAVTGPIIATPAIALSVVEGASPELVIGAGTAGVDFGITLTTVAAGDDVIIMHSGVMNNGTTELFAVVEREQKGLGHFHGGFGMLGTQWDLNQQKGSDPTNAFQFLGRNAKNGTATYGTGTKTAAGTFNAFNVGANFQFFGENGLFSTFGLTPTTNELFPQRCNASMASAASPVDPMGLDGPEAHSKDTFIASGQFALFSHDDVRAGPLVRAIGNLESSLFWMNTKTVGAATNAYMFWYPTIQYGDSAQEGGGKGGQGLTTFPWMGKKDATHSITMAVARFTSLPLTAP